MIHYTLLPEKEIRTLKKEYRTRFLIILLFFICFAVVIGIAALVPAYLYSASQDKEARLELKNIEEDRKGTGVESILKEFTEVNNLVKRIKTNQSPFVSSDLIGRIISQKTPGIQITSFQFSVVNDNVKNATSTTHQIIVQGKSGSRDALINFKDNLEATPLFTKVELPVSDLTKNKDIPFSIRLSILKPK